MACSGSGCLYDSGHVVVVVGSHGGLSDFGVSSGGQEGRVRGSLAIGCRD